METYLGELSINPVCECPPLNLLMLHCWGHTHTHKHRKKQISNNMCKKKTPKKQKHFEPKNMAKNKNRINLHELHSVFVFVVFICWVASHWMDGTVSSYSMWVSVGDCTKISCTWDWFVSAIHMHKVSEKRFFHCYQDGWVCSVLTTHQQQRAATLPDAPS